MSQSNSPHRYHPAFARGQYDHAEGWPRGHNPYSSTGDQAATLAWWAGWDAAEQEAPQ